MQYLSAFLDDLQTEHTQRAYRTDLTKFFARSADDLSDLRAEQVETADVRDFLRAMRDEELSYATRRRRLSAIRRFYDWLNAQGHVSGNPARGPDIEVRKTTEQETSSRFLEKEELERLISAAAESQTAVRGQALILVILYAALRRSEVAALNVDHVRPLGRHWVVDVPSASGSPGGFVKIPDLAADAVQRVVDLYDEGQGPLWRSYSNRNLGERMSPDAIYKCIRRYGKEAELGEIDIETIRRSGLRLALESGARPTHVQLHARLEELESTIRYIDDEPDEARLQNTVADHIDLNVTLYSASF